MNDWHPCPDCGGKWGAHEPDCPQVASVPPVSGEPPSAFEAAFPLSCRCGKVRGAPSEWSDKARCLECGTYLSVGEVTVPSAFEALLDKYALAIKNMVQASDHPEMPTGVSVAQSARNAVIAAYRHRPEAPKDDDNWAAECLDMVRERLEQLGMDMKGCPPMMYDDAVRNLAARLGKLAGLTTWGDVKTAVEAAAKDATPFAEPLPAEQPVAPVGAPPDPTAHPCPARKWERCCPYPSVCRKNERCEDGEGAPPGVREAAQEVLTEMERDGDDYVTYYAKRLRAASLPSETPE